MAVHYEKKDKVGYITLEGRGPMNMFSPDTIYKPLYDILVNYKEDPQTRVVVISGPQEKEHFSSGADIRAVKSRGASESSGYATVPGRIFRPTDEARYREIFTGEIKLFKPVIFAISGYCIGAATLLMMALADIVVVSEDFTFGLPELKKGIGPSSYSATLLPQKMPWVIAMELLFTGRFMYADEAQRVGIINRIVADKDALNTATTDLANEIAANPPLHIHAAKQLSLLARDIPLPMGELQGQLYSALLMNVPDSKEGPRAFLEKRPPQFTGELEE